MGHTFDSFPQFSFENRTIWYTTNPTNLDSKNTMHSTNRTMLLFSLFFDSQAQDILSPDCRRQKAKHTINTKGIQQWRTALKLDTVFPSSLYSFCVHGVFSFFFRLQSGLSITSALQCLASTKLVPNLHSDPTNHTCRQAHYKMLL